jgi:Mrp family chromosome partitioning ATPase/capsular polysaccharide biosynthesis protein
VAQARSIQFELAQFEHLVETQRGHIVRVKGTWTSTARGELPHPTLLAGPDDAAVRVAPLPIPGQAPPATDGETPWLATYSIPKHLFEGTVAPRCRLQPAPEVLIDLPALDMPEPGTVTATRPPISASSMAAPAAEPPAPSAAAPAPAPAGKGFRDLLGSALRAHKRLIAAVAAVAVLGSLAGLALRSPTYRASSQLLVTPLPSDSSALQGLVRAGGDPAQTVDTAAALVGSHDAAVGTARKLGAGWSVQRVLDHVSVTPHGDSNVLDIEADADNGPDAARASTTFTLTALALRDAQLRRLADTALARATAARAAITDPTGAEAEALDVRIAELNRIKANGDPTLSLLKRAAVPLSADGLPVPAILVLGLIAGLILGAGAAVLYDLAGPGRIDSEGDIHALYPVPILTRLPALPRNVPAATAAPVREALRTLEVQLALAEGRHRALMVSSASSGDGKTTTAIGLALELAAAQRAVILVDLDLRKPDLANRLGVRVDRGIEDLLAGSAPLADVLTPVPGHHGVELLAPVGQTHLGTLDDVARQLPDIVEGATALADYVVIDSPPLGEVSDALTFAPTVDDLLLVCRLGRTRRSSFVAMRDLLRRVGHEPSGLIVIGGAGTSVPVSTYPVATGGVAP